MTDQERTEDQGGLAPTAEEEVMARQLALKAGRLLDQMSAGQRTVFLLARVEGLGYAEISDLDTDSFLGQLALRPW